MLTGKQRAYLRKLANPIQPIFQIGKDGIGENLIKQIDEALEARELIKITILESALLDTRSTCDELAKQTHAEPVQSIGSKFVLYRESREKKKIELPR